MKCPMCDSKEVLECGDLGRDVFQCHSCGYVINVSFDDSDDFD